MWQVIKYVKYYGGDIVHIASLNTSVDVCKAKTFLRHSLYLF